MLNPMANNLLNGKFFRQVKVFCSRLQPYNATMCLK